ncbi:MAG: bifunctional [glutamate--ammonia ligase]-adenylyl-L-tyrosine phosphorylase/[glutamate--ammonia-ligase] adenylyltransferase, partial [FCB group bacterium]|nr:bifunctional [glutamate--ammonia ligase]-adenylyl-L-tyrosine phosphorylase/[glutamate--ammonia-ligase] adenylyltransferase [FCB group bacterium]
MAVQGNPADVSTYFSSIPFQERAQAEQRLAALLESDRAGLADNLLFCLEKTAEPDRVLVSLERFLEAATGSQTHLGLMAAAPRYTQLLIEIFDQSHFLTEIVCRNPAYTLWLWEEADLNRAVPVEEMSAELRDQLAAFDDFRAQCQSMRRFKRREILRIGVRDIYAHASVASVTEDLSNLADAALQAAVQIGQHDLAPRFGRPLAPSGEEATFAVIAMGKLGGRELNFSSDIDLLFLYSEDGETSDEGAKQISNAEYFSKLGERIIFAISEQTDEGRVFRVDMRLRPFGRMGALAAPLGNCLDYYEHFGRAWERQALIKARTAAGDIALGNRLIEATRPFVFPRYFDDETLEDIQETKRQMEAQIAERGETDIEVKLGRGGIRDIEFTVQILQLLNGGKVPALRTRNSLEAINILGQEQLLTPFEATELAANYVFLRQVEHRLQIEGSQQIHVLPSAPEALDVLARRLGYQNGESFMTVYRDKTEANRKILERFLASEGSGNLWISDLLNRASDGDVGKGRLEALGFHDPRRAREEFLLLCNGTQERPHSLHVRQQFYSFAPVLIRSLADSTRPDENLMRLGQVFARLRAPGPIFELLRLQPELSDLLVKVVANSEFLSGILIREPGLFDLFSTPSALEEPSPRESLEREMALLENAVDAQAAPYRLRDGELLHIGLRELLEKNDVIEVGHELSTLAEVILGHAVRVARTEVARRFGPAEAAFGVLTLGKLGGREMGYGSDLDLLFVFDPDGAIPEGTSRIEYFTALAAATIRVLKEPTRYGRLYDIDARLRPEGKKGMLTVSGPRLAEYYRKQAQAWEHLALMKVRAVGGDTGFAEA